MLQLRAYADARHCYATTHGCHSPPAAIDMDIYIKSMDKVYGMEASPLLSDISRA
jgi:hypothetical protein